jgi:hypothetical protein
MNPSRLETTCKVTIDPVAFFSLDIIPPGLADIETGPRLFPAKNDRIGNPPQSA